MLRVPGAIIRSTSLVRPTHRATPRICCRPFRLAVPHWFGPGSVSTPAPPHQLGIRQCESGRPSCDRDDPPATRFPYGVNRYCHRAPRISGESPCSTQSNRPPGFRTRRISARAAIGCGIEQRVQVITIASKVALAKGMSSAEALISDSGKTLHCSLPHETEQFGGRIETNYTSHCQAIQGFKHPLQSLWR
jgi:hypothetical protein